MPASGLDSPLRSSPFSATLCIQGIRVKELSQKEYEATFSPPMVNVTERAEEVVDLWAYADPIIDSDYHSCAAWEWKVAHIYETADGKYQHIGIPVPIDNTYLTIIADKSNKVIIGHYLLALGE